MVPELNEMGENAVEFLTEGDFHDGESDLLPEYCQYKDEGCDLADSCLECPFPQCIYEQPGGKRHWQKNIRDGEITRLFASEDKGIKELALIFGISQRTVQRALKDTLCLKSKTGRENTLHKGDMPGNE